jgi:hypothetical protein
MTAKKKARTLRRRPTSTSVDEFESVVTAQVQETVYEVIVTEGRLAALGKDLALRAGDTQFVASPDELDAVAVVLGSHAQAVLAVGDRHAVAALSSGHIPLGHFPGKRVLGDLRSWSLSIYPIFSRGCNVEVVDAPRRQLRPASAAMPWMRSEHALGGGLHCWVQLAAQRRLECLGELRGTAEAAFGVFGEG